MTAHLAHHAGSEGPTRDTIPHTFQAAARKRANGPGAGKRTGAHSEASYPEQLPDRCEQCARQAYAHQLESETAACLVPLCCARCEAPAAVLLLANLSRRCVAACCSLHTSIPASGTVCVGRCICNQWLTSGLLCRGVKGTFIDFTSAADDYESEDALERAILDAHAQANAELDQHSADEDLEEDYKAELASREPAEPAQPSQGAAGAALFSITRWMRPFCHAGRWTGVARPSEAFILNSQLPNRA